MGFDATNPGLFMFLFIKMKRPTSIDRRLGKKHSRAFTLIEILLAIALMGVVMSAMVVGFGGIFEANTEKAARMFVENTVKPNMMQYRMDMGSYPSTADGLEALLNPPSGEKAAYWHGPYADKIPLDPWKNHYQYACPGTHNPRGYDLWSLGPDGIVSEDDIGNW